MVRVRARRSAHEMPIGRTSGVSPARGIWSLLCSGMSRTAARTKLNQGGKSPLASPVANQAWQLTASLAASLANGTDGASAVSISYRHADAPCAFSRGSALYTRLTVSGRTLRRSLGSGIGRESGIRFSGLRIGCLRRICSKISGLKMSATPWLSRRRAASETRPRSSLPSAFFTSLSSSVRSRGSLPRLRAIAFAHPSMSEAWSPERQAAKRFAMARTVRWPPRADLRKKREGATIISL
mmetsp:Transcript_24343/g.57657  ORF Transcript_24343/g.57657 Transcript_24343/m.57657 type:complete len:240 (-) Transcript_24343:692-1411(-)